MQWYYSQSGSPTGPISAEDVGALLDDGTITSGTLLWSRGMEQWRRLDELEEFAPLLDGGTPPPLPPEEPATSYGPFDPPRMPTVEPQANYYVLDETPPGTPSLAGPWTRYWARTIDIGIIGTLLLTGIFLALPAINYEWYLALYAADTRVLVLCTLPLIGIINALCIALLGNSLGKAIFGVRAEVIGDPRRLSLREAIGREYRVWTAGLALGIPFFNLFTMIPAYRRVASNLPTDYDSSLFTVRAHSKSGLRRALGIVFAILLTALILYSNALDKVALDNIRVPFTWTNPVTGLSARVPGGWLPEVLPGEDGATLYAFTNLNTGIIALLAAEHPAAPMTFTTYTNNLTAVLGTTTRLQGEWELLAPSLWMAIGSGEGELMATTIFVTWDGDAFWRLVYVDQVGEAARDLSDPSMREALLRSTGSTF